MAWLLQLPLSAPLDQPIDVRLQCSSCFEWATWDAELFADLIADGPPYLCCPNCGQSDRLPPDDAVPYGERDVRGRQTAA